MKKARLVLEFEYDEADLDEICGAIEDNLTALDMPNGDTLFLDKIVIMDNSD